MWVVYILRCADNTLYTGITNDLEHRLETHNSGRGAKYTRGRLPVQVLYFERCPDHGAALRRELAIKRLSRSAKDDLVDACRMKTKDEGLRDSTGSPSTGGQS